MKKSLFTLLFFSIIVSCVLMLSACDGEVHSHTFETEWTTDADNHWHEASCEHTDVVSGLASHTWDDGVVLSMPTATSPGQKKYTCTVCGKEKIVDVAPVNAKNVGVHYDLNGGAWDEYDDVIPDYTVQYINSNSIILTEQVPVLVNCVFGGWDVQIDLIGNEANVKAVWFAGMEGITDENGDPINPKRLTMDGNGDPDFIPTKSTTYIDVNENGRQDDDEPVEEYTFIGWKSTTSIDGNTIRTPYFTKTRLTISIKFDFNGGYPSNVLNGITPYNLENPNQQGGFYYQAKKVYAYNSPSNLITYRATIMDDDTIKCYANANSADICAWNGYDQVSIPVCTGYDFIGWATDRAGTNIVIRSYSQTHQTDGHTIYISTADCHLPIMYAIYKEAKPLKMETRVAFDFNGGYPSMSLGGSISTTLDTSASIWETDTDPALNHYVQYKAVEGYSTSNTTFEFSVDDDPTLNSVIDHISIPTKTGFTFTGWGLAHDSTPVILANSGSFIYHTDTATFTYDGGNSPVDVGAFITLYAQWRSNERNGKIIVQFVEDNVDFSTGDGTYHSDMVYTPQSGLALSSNPDDGIFLESIFNYGGTPIAKPNPNPVGGIYYGINYVFDHWTYDAVENPTLDAFDANTVVDVPYVLNSSSLVVVLRLYAVYKPADELFYHGSVDVSPSTQGVKIPITEADYGKYLIVVYCCDYDDEVNPPNCGVRVKALDDGINPPTLTQLVEAVPADYLIYYPSTFEVTFGSALYLEFFLPHTANAGQWFIIDIYYLG